ncbi:MAG: hypothetical protein SFU87_13920 [Chitinophagaceae bacterium]|nr:hypothetical protein [Chitinophagaceae bacterium]
MKLLLFVASLLFVAIGFLPYKQAWVTDTSSPDHLIVDPQECGCPCPDAAIVKGHLYIPEDSLKKYPAILKNEVNLEIPGFNDHSSYELIHAKLYVKGVITGFDTVLCTPDNCEMVPEFLVSSWAVVDYIPQFWSFPGWAIILSVVNLIALFPALLIMTTRNLKKKN